MSNNKKTTDGKYVLPIKKQGVQKIILVPKEWPFNTGDNVEIIFYVKEGEKKSVEDFKGELNERGIDEGGE